MQNLDLKSEKKFFLKDVFYNNGIVNFYQFAKDKEEELGIKCILEKENELLLRMSSEKENEIYEKILKEFLKDEGIVHQTANDRYYFDETRMNFILDKKFDTKGWQKNDTRNGIYLYKNINELGMQREEVEKLYLEFCNKNKLTAEKESNGALKVPNKNNEVIVMITLEEAINNFQKYLIPKNIVDLDSKIHPFEDGQKAFHDMLKPAKNFKLDKWDALIYSFGARTKRFYNSSYFIYLNSSSLLALNDFKKFLGISDDKIPSPDKNGKIININSNINFSKNKINNLFILSKSKEEFEVKFFIYIFLIIYNIEEQYKKTNERRLASRKKLFETIKYLSFVLYEVDGDFRLALNEYTKAYKLMQFFQNVKEFEDSNGENAELFSYLIKIFNIFSSSQNKNELNLNLQNWCKNLLNFKDLRKDYYLASFNILKSSSKDLKIFGKKLFDFEQSYLFYILGEKNMNIHENSKKVGDAIGYFCATINDKDLLFKLRNIKNYKQMLSYFKDLKFSALKNEKDARFSKEFNNALENILVNLQEDWEVARDYIAIYAIDNFKATLFHKSKQGE